MALDQEGQPLVIDPEQVQDRRLQVVNVDRPRRELALVRVDRVALVVGDVVTVRIGLAVGDAFSSITSACSVIISSR